MLDSPMWLLYTRPGFEKEVAAEISDLAGVQDDYGYVQAKDQAGYVCWVPQTERPLTEWARAYLSPQLVFARAGVWVGARLTLPSEDRVTPLMECIGQLPKCSGVVFGWPDTNDGKSVSSFCKKFKPTFERHWRKSACVDASSSFTLHLFWLDGTHVFVGIASSRHESPWHMGVPRLRFPPEAPSRSTLKLEEAIHYFGLTEQHMAPGMVAVDLGACPGGWTYQLVKRHLRVHAVDNGAVADSLMDSGLVTHHQKDGFVFRPFKAVDWVVCDMVEQPSRVISLMADWVAKGDARNALFNLKLPMKKRYQAYRDCLDLLDQRMQGGNRYRFSAKHLYHDREEITCLLERL